MVDIIGIVDNIDHRSFYRAVIVGHRRDLASPPRKSAHTLCIFQHLNGR